MKGGVFFYNNNNKKYIKKKKGLASSLIVPAHLNPNLTWRGAHLSNNGAYHYPDSQV